MSPGTGQSGAVPETRIDPPRVTGFGVTVILAPPVKKEGSLGIVVVLVGDDAVDDVVEGPRWRPARCSEEEA